MKFEAYKKFKQTPYSIYLLNIERRKLGKSTELFPVELELFKTIEDAKNFASKGGLSEDEYKIIKWRI